MTWRFDSSQAHYIQKKSEWPLKKKLSVLVFVFLCVNALALEFSPNTAMEMDATITLHAKGAIEGPLAQTDTMELMFLTFPDTKNQSVIEHSEKIFFGDREFLPQYETRKGNKYAVFRIENLAQFEQTRSFRIESISRIMTKARIGLEEKNQDNTDKSEFLQETSYIETNDPVLKSKAEIEFLGTDKVEVVRKVAQWVNSNIEYDFENYYGAVFSARQTYDSRKGVCDEFANLTAAFTRIKGIPTKYVTGISFDGKRFGNHGWLEVFLDKYGWVGLDSTFGEAGFVDAAHFVLGKNADANDVFNIKIITRTKDSVRVQSSLELPQVKINDVGFFEGVTQARVEHPQKVSSLQNFTVKAVVKNNLTTDAIIPIQLSLHPDFYADQKLKLEKFGPLEEKNIEWKATAPRHLDEKSYLKYGVFLFTPDQNVAGEIEVHFSQGNEPEIIQVTFFDVSPSLDENNLTIFVKIRNDSPYNASAKISGFLGGEKIAEKETMIEPLSTKTESITVENFSSGKVELLMQSDGVEKKSEIIVPAQKEKPIQVTEKKLAGENSDNPPTPNGLQEVAIVVAVLAGIFFAASFFVFVRKKN